MPPSGCRGRISPGRRGTRGFTLVELMIVVAVIAVITAVALPNLLTSRMAANEASAVQSLRTITTMNERYKMRFQTYASSLTDLQNVGYITQDLGSSSKSGYNFGYSGSTWSYSCSANPVTPGETGNNYYFCDSSGVIRFSTTGAATASSPPIGQ